MKCQKLYMIFCCLVVSCFLVVPFVTLADNTDNAQYWTQEDVDLWNSYYGACFEYYFYHYSPTVGNAGYASGTALQYAKTQTGWSEAPVVGAVRNDYDPNLPSPDDPDPDPDPEDETSSDYLGPSVEGGDTMTGLTDFLADCTTIVTFFVDSAMEIGSLYTSTPVLAIVILTPIVIKIVRLFRSMAR